MRRAERTKATAGADVAVAVKKGPELRLRLYVAGSAPNSILAIANVRAICEEHFTTYHLEIVNLLEHPGRALADGVIVTPTLLKLAPEPQQRAVGNLSDTKQVLLTLASL